MLEGMSLTHLRYWALRY